MEATGNGSQDGGEMLDIKAASTLVDRHRTTISHWLHNGVLNRYTNQRVYMKYEMLGGQVQIRREWISQFIAALQPPAQ